MATNWTDRQKEKKAAADLAVQAAEVGTLSNGKRTVQVIDGDMQMRTEMESMAARLQELERRVAGMEIPGDFKGSVTGKWEGIGDQGEGLVSYKGKTYKTKRMGFASIPQGAPVELVYANGVYYSNY